MAEKKPTGTVLVAGAGISGIKAAIELAETGYKVLLTDASTQVGGILAKLDYQFPTDHCGMCRMLPMVGREYSSEYCMRKSLYHENIEILPFTEVVNVSGDAGKYTVELKKKARYVNAEVCNEMGKCIDVCPVEVEDEFNHGLTMRKAIYKSIPHNVPQLLLIDKDACTECGQCVEVCSTNAIDLNAQDVMETREVHSIILASGVKLYNTREFEDAKSYAVSPDVVTSLAFERMLSSTGTYNYGTITRPSDGKPARKIAWIQCMGSRNRRQNRDYCSSVCCMFALKEAVLAKEKGGTDIEATIFYMDMRTFGKGFQQYRENAVDEHGVKLIRCRVQEVVREPDGSLRIRYFDPDTNEFFIEHYDIVVLSTGQIPFADHKKWADLISADLNPLGLLATEPYSKVKIANKQGIYMCGSLMGLTDISEAMSSGIAAAGEATNFLTTIDVETTLGENVAEPKTDDRGLPNVAVLICKCGEFAGAEGFDAKLLEAQLTKVHQVGAVHVIESICSEAGRQEALDILSESGCNRLLIGACQPYMYRRKIKDLARKAGFNSSLVQIFDFLGISRRGIHEDDKAAWTLRAIKAITSDISSMKEKPALHVRSIPINHTALVVGGGIGGMQSALSLANRGVPVHLVEKSGELGGFAGNFIASTVDGLAPMEMAKDMKLKVYENKKITVHLNAQVEKTEGSLGSFESKLVYNGNGENEYLHHGAVIMATGGKEGATEEYGYGQSDNIMTQFEFKQGLENGKIDLSEAEDVVMIQCAGSREKGKREYCSRICCMWAVANALKIKEKNPETRVFVLYRDMMTYGFLEQYYTKARLAGVIFVSYSPDSKPQVELVEGKPVITFNESVLNSPVELSPNYLVLSTGVDPEPSNKDLAKAFSLELNHDGFFNEADSKWRPIELKQIGTFLAGAAHSPMPLPDVIMQAEAAAQKAYTYLSGGDLQTARITSTVKDSLCIRCQRCVSVCPFGARSYNEMENRIEVDPAGCQGCGMCAVACRNNATEVSGWSDRQFMSVIDSTLSDDLEFSTVK
ncbi:4Fe-4S binding protein [Desulfopila inferna]|uniref:4Fe-4S binding protein n=1 Tax=Desulfopila inferna TaxID=468528 RepID=UPI001965A195|nr:4Fe-4S binding protein [Desulfopila inferna]MBM9605189.1 CoB--CoM heterodisulfide reductase iron-sulfur subunit A family protein [Desulfopila inferna]